MDILTQGLLGSTLAQSSAGKDHIRMATIVGFIAGLVADLDILIRSSSDPLLNIEYHRHFTHALLFIPAGALVAALFLWPFFRHRLSFRSVYLYSFMGYSLSGVLDACTSYGTYLFWPFSDQRMAWNIISIVDPVFTGLLLAAMIFAFRKQAALIARAGLVLGVLYMLVGWVQLQRAEAEVMQLAQQRGHQIKRLEVKPTLGNLLLWRSIYENDEVLHVDAVRVGLLSSPRIFPGASVRLFRLENNEMAIPVDSVLYNDFRRFDEFSDGYVAIAPGRPGTLSDIRYSNLPNSLEPLWGIEFDPLMPDRHVSFSFYRDMSRANRDAFVSMLLDREKNAGQ